MTIESTFQALWPISLTWSAVLVALCLIFAVTIYSHERGRCEPWLRGLLAVLRFALMLFVLWMIAGWSWLPVRIQPPELVLAVDVSSSMQTPDGYASNSGNPLTRLARAQQLLAVTPQQLDRLMQNYQIRLYGISQDAIAIGGKPISRVDLLNFSEQARQDSNQTDASRLGDALLQILQRQAGRSTAAIVLLSDGIVTSGASLMDAAAQARRSTMPIYSITLGRNSRQPDLRLTDLLAEPQVYLGDRVAVEVTAIASDLGTATATVRLIESSTGRELDQQQVRFSDSENQHPITLGFIPASAGEIALKVSVDPQPEELNTTNNQEELTIVVQNRTIRVLLVFAEPSYEFRFLKHYLERTTQVGNSQVAAFSLKSVLQSGELDYVLQDNSALRFIPSDESQLAQFDQFIFGTFDPTIVPGSTLEAIVRNVTVAGAGCAFVSSDESFVKQLADTPLATLLPIESTQALSDRTGPYRLQVTKLGQSALPLQWSQTDQGLAPKPEIPLFESIVHVDRLKTGAQTLALASTPSGTTPLLITQFAGAGRTMLMATDETYRWTGFGGSDAIHQQFWGQTLRWLSRGKLNSIDQAQLIVDPQQVPFGEAVRVQLRLSQASDWPQTSNVRISSSTGESRTEALSRVSGAPNLYQCTVTDLTPGKYRAVLIEPALAISVSTDFNVIAPPTEQANLRSDVAAMQQLAESSRGKHYLDAEADQWFQQLPLGNPARLDALPPEPMWNRWWVAGLFVLVITAEWLLRRRARMV